jgi:hypothetical protein
MTISRTDTIYRGRAIVTYDGVTLYSSSPVTVRTRQELFDIPVAGAGVIDRKIKQVVTEVTLTPHGEISAGILSKLFPHTSATPGSSAVPATDKSLVIHPANGKEKLTFKNAFVSKMPDLLLSTVKTALGQVTFTAFGTNAELWSVAEHFVKVEDAAFSDTGLSASGVKTVPYTASLGALSAPWNGILTKTGWTVSFDVGLDAQEEDTVGIFDYLYNGQARISARCNPIGLKVADLHGLMLLQGTGAARGASGTGLKQALTITGGSGNIVLVVNNCVLETAPHQYDIGDRVNELEFVTVRSLTTGALDALFSIGLVS